MKNNILKIEDGIAYLELTQGKVAMVSEEDLELVGKHRWCAYCASKKTDQWYARTKLSKGVLTDMHRLVMSATKGTEVDHHNHNGLDNTRGNLRVGTHAQNNWNRRLYSNKSSKWKGVSWCKRKQRWKVSLKVNNRRVYIGSFRDEVSAAQAYNFAAYEHFGEFSYQNSANRV